MFSRSLFAAALAAIGMSAFGFDPPAYDATYTEQGVTYAQRGGLGMKDFVVTNIVVNGQPRPLPPYLYLLELDDTYQEDAEWYYQNAGYSGGGRCSVRRDGNAVERNYDWHFDDAATFVLKVSGEDGRRFASVSVANVGTNLTDKFVRSGAWSRFYKCLAGTSVDGVNENGVFAEVNVTSGSWGRTSGTVHGLGAVRWVLDHGTNAQQAAEYIAANVYLPQGFGVNLHYLVADRSKTYIVENGEAHEVTDTPAVMTNFNVDRQGGEGYERYASLTNGATIQSQWWTKAYDPETRPIRFSDLGTNYESIWERWASKTKEEHRGEITAGESWWQTVHCSVYDLQKLTLRIAVQEVEDWYVFKVQNAGTDEEKVREIATDVVAPVAAAVELKADKATTYTKGEMDSLLDGKVSKSGDTMTGDLVVNHSVFGEYYFGGTPDSRIEADFPSGIYSEAPVFGQTYYGGRPGNAKSAEFPMGIETETISGISVPQDKTGETFALLSDIPQSVEEVDPLSYHMKQNITIGQITNDFGETVPSAVKVGNVEQWETYGSHELSLDPKRGFTAKIEDDGTVAVLDANGIRWWGGGYPAGVYKELNFWNLPSFLSSTLADTVSAQSEYCECISTNICKLIAPHITPVNVVAQYWDETMSANWVVVIDNEDMKYSVSTNTDQTAFIRADPILEDETTRLPYRIVVEGSEMKFFTK